MITNTTSAWILNKKGIGETSFVVTFFTPDHGVMVSRCKGVRRAKNHVQLQPFTPLWVHFRMRADRYYMQQIEMMAPTLPFSGTVLFSALYLNELLTYGLCPQDPHELLFTMYSETLQAMTTVQDAPSLEALLRRFELLFLDQIGYQLPLTQDINQNPIDSERYYQFIPGEGFIEAQQGILGAHLHAFSGHDFNHLDVLKSAKWLMRRAISHALDGKRIHSRNLFI